MLKKSHILDLLTNYFEVGKTLENIRRGSNTERICMGFSEPIAYTRIFQYDYRECTNDPVKYLEQVIKENIWRLENIEDDIPMQSSFRVPFKWFPYTFFGLYSEFDYQGLPLISGNESFIKTHDISSLEPIDFRKTGEMPKILNWYDMLSELVDEKIHIELMEFSRGPLDIVIKLLGYEDYIVKIYEDPEFIHMLMKFVTEQRNSFNKERAKYLNVPIPHTTIADDWVHMSFIPEPIFREFVLPYYHEIEEFQDGVEAYHTCGDHTEITGEIANLKGMTWMQISAPTNIRSALEQIPKGMMTEVRFNPSDVLYASAESLEKKFREIAEWCEERPYRVQAAGVTPVFDTIQKFVDNCKRWTDLAKKYVK